MLVVLRLLVVVMLLLLLVEVRAAMLVVVVLLVLLLLCLLVVGSVGLHVLRLLLLLEMVSSRIGSWHELLNAGVGAAFASRHDGVGLS